MRSHCFEFTARDCVVFNIRIVEASVLHVSQTDLLDDRLRSEVLRLHNGHYTSEAEYFKSISHCRRGSFGRETHSPELPRKSIPDFDLGGVIEILQPAETDQSIRSFIDDRP